MNRCKTWFFSWIFPWVPKRLLSRFVGMLMRIPLPRAVAVFAVPAFASFFGIDMSEAEHSPETYSSLDDFFTRKLKPGLRPIQGKQVFPVDGVLTQAGWINQGTLVQAKGWDYSLSDLLGDSQLASQYEGGAYNTFYLCPRDYHRVHAPTAGHLVSARHIPGLLWPVNDWSVHNVRKLFCLNERVVLNFTSETGPWSLVLVGATNVGHMTITPDPSIVTNRWLWHAPTDRVYSPPIPIQPGDELGMFHLGSTVICVYAKSFPQDILQVPKPVKMGQV